MEPAKSAIIIKCLLFLQTFILIGIGVCEVIQLAEVNNTQEQIIQHPEDWNYLFGYTSNLFTILIRVYFWLVILISLGILGWTMESFERRWRDLQNYNDTTKNITLLALWTIATVPNIILLSDSNRLKTCSESTYTYTVPDRLLRHCNAYLASLFLAFIFILTIIIQLLFSFVVVRHQKEISMKPPPNIQEPKKLKVRRSRRVNKKRNSLKSAMSEGTRLSMVTEDEEERTRSSKSTSRSTNNKVLKNGLNSEMKVNSNV